jgi:hypothetical protein
MMAIAVFLIFLKKVSITYQGYYSWKHCQHIEETTTLNTIENHKPPITYLTKLVTKSSEENHIPLRLLKIGHLGCSYVLVRFHAFYAGDSFHDNDEPTFGIYLKAICFVWII